MPPAAERLSVGVGGAGRYEQFHDQGFEVLGFPANDFAGQEPGSSEEIVSFCTTNFGVDFPMFSKPTTSEKFVSELS